MMKKNVKASNCLFAQCVGFQVKVLLCYFSLDASGSDALCYQLFYLEL